MALRGKFLHRLLLVAIILAATSASQMDSGCNRTCGSVNIPYPFGSSEGCYLDRDFFISCRNNFSSGTLTPYMGNGNVTVLNISLDGKLRISSDVAKRCYKPSNMKNVYDRGFSEIELTPAGLRLAQFRVSYEKNKITAVGCGTYVYIRGYDGDMYYTTGCLSLCDTNSTGSNVVNGSCSGIGCCQTSIPKGATNYSLNVGSLGYSFRLGYPSRRVCGFGFIGDQDAFKFSSLDLADLQGRESVPLVLDWAVGRNNCEVAEKNKISYACKAKNSHCYNSTNGPGYLCNCSSGYKGNPYVLDGCEDVNECETSNPCIGTAKCNNLAGSFKCSCPKGYEGDGRKNGTGCTRTDKKSSTWIITIALGVSISVIVLLVAYSWLYWGLQKRKLMKLKEKFFQQNGGLMLQQQLASYKGSVETAKIFSSKELEEATNNFNKTRILGQGGYGTVYKGILLENKVVAIKKSKISDEVDKRQIQQFINEVIVLTQINHRNVVKLLGCCLETEVPLLVYEFITNGTLSEHIHEKGPSFLLSWEKRLKIATETASALAYLHSEASMPIIHRDVKSANILLDDNHTAKVSDFGASRLVPLDHTQLNTLVQGTFGYLDPEYFQTGQLTEKSDVYSFGVVISELLTSEKAVSMDRSESERNLAMYMVSAMKEGRLLQILDHHLVNEDNIEEIKKVADIAKRCLMVTGENRPTMKEVAMELEGLRIMEKHSWKKVDLDAKETEYSPKAPAHPFSNVIDTGCSSNSTITTGEDSMKNQGLKPTDDGR